MIDSVHFILTYMCNLECEHCFINCGPNARGTFTWEQLQRIIDDCQRMGSIKSLSFEGGEAFLFYPLLLEGVRLASKRGFASTVVSNCYWATTVADAELWLRPLAEAGLSTLEVSDDVFHYGHIAETPARRALLAAGNLGLPGLSIQILEPGCKDNGSQEKGSPIYKGTPKFRGRAVEKLTRGLPTSPWNVFRECIREDLRNPSRVHIDPFGNVHLCQGLIIGNIEQNPLPEIITKYDPDAHPIAGPLLKGGPAQLVETYGLGHDDQYVDGCHLCSQACMALIDKFPASLAPRSVYGL